MNTAEYLSNNPLSHILELKQQENFNPSCLDTNFKLPVKLGELIYKQTNFVKKLLEDGPHTEDSVKLLKYLCWENMNFSLVLLNELLWMTAYHYSYELKPHLELLYHLLILRDSWQSRRILISLKGIQSDRDGLFEIITKSQNHYQKRAYQIIKMLVQLFTICEPALDILNTDEDLKRIWKQSRNWFQSEMEKCLMYDMRTYGYYQTPQSNETSQTYYLERTQSARVTLERAMKICPSVNNENIRTLQENSEKNVNTNNVLNNDNNSTTKSCLVKKSHKKEMVIKNFFIYRAINFK